jgi:hypothetical protein
MSNIFWLHISRFSRIWTDCWHTETAAVMGLCRAEIDATPFHRTSAFELSGFRNYGQQIDRLQSGAKVTAAHRRARATHGSKRVYRYQGTYFQPREDKLLLAELRIARNRPTLLISCLRERACS